MLQPPKRDPALDGLRGIAVLMVFVFHYGGGLTSPHFALRLLGHITQAGWTGVDLFFALSGFLITGLLLESMQDAHWVRNFYARRALRILPLYYAALALCALASLARGHTFADLRTLILYVVFLQNFPPYVFPALNLPLTLPLYHLWSLAVEEQFYLIWPFLLWLVRSRRKTSWPRGAFWLCVIAFTASVLFRAVVFGLRHFSNYQAFSVAETLPTQMGPLLLGAIVAIVFRSRHKLLLLRYALPAFFAGLAIYLLSSALCGRLTLASRFQFVLGLPGIALACAALIPLALNSGLPRSFFSMSPLRFLGRISYGFYVFHILLQPLFDIIAEHLTRSTSGSAYQLARFVAGFPITLLAAWLSFHLLELPFLRLKRRFPTHDPLPPEFTTSKL